MSLIDTLSSIANNTLNRYRLDTGACNIDSLLNQQILPVLSQQLLSRMSEQQRTTSLALGWDEEEGIVLEFGE